MEFALIGCRRGCRRGCRESWTVGCAATRKLCPLTAYSILSAGSGSGRSSPWGASARTSSPTRGSGGRWTPMRRCCRRSTVGDSHLCSHSTAAIASRPAVQCTCAHLHRKLRVLVTRECECVLGILANLVSYTQKATRRYSIRALDWSAIVRVQSSAGGRQWSTQRSAVERSAAQLSAAQRSVVERSAAQCSAVQWRRCADYHRHKVRVHPQGRAECARRLQGRVDHVQRCAPLRCHYRYPR